MKQAARYWRNAVWFLTIGMVVLLAGCGSQSKVLGDGGLGGGPYVVATNPSDGEAGVNTKQGISVLFSNDMDPSSIHDMSFYVTSGSVAGVKGAAALPNGGRAAGSISHNKKRAYFTPKEELIPKQIYTIVITDEVTDVNGVHMAESYTATFVAGSNGDIDGDGILDVNDNCPTVPNPDQNDSDNDGIGDVCDAGGDSDGDGIDDGVDNCPTVPNPDQSDIDGDGAGDVCDSDIDGDTVPNVIDNCVYIPNLDQSDLDGDGKGDACDTDIDGDKIPNDLDNCIYVPNPDQSDSENDGLGDACDSDDDNDGIADSDDNCPVTPNPDQSDVDGDGAGDSCDSDIDGDTVPNVTDNCVYEPNPDQVDTDGDGIGDACSDDKDGDGILDGEDNCVYVPNPLQEDKDNDGVGDACDNDSDNDGIADDVDNCPQTPNPDQADSDDDGIGDVCDDKVTMPELCGADGDAIVNLGQNRASVESESGGLLCSLLGLLCPTISGDANLIDPFPESGAKAFTLLEVAGTATLRVTDDDEVHPGGSSVGFVVRNPGELLALTVAEKISLRTYLDGELQEEMNGSALIDLNLLGVGETEKVYYHFYSSKDFDAVEITFAGLVSLLDTIHIFGACVE